MCQVGRKVSCNGAWSQRQPNHEVELTGTKLEVHNNTRLVRLRPPAPPLSSLQVCSPAPEHQSSLIMTLFLFSPPYRTRARLRLEAGGSRAAESSPPTAAAASSAGQLRQRSRPWRLRRREGGVRRPAGGDRHRPGGADWARRARVVCSAHPGKRRPRRHVAGTACACAIERQLFKPSARPAAHYPPFTVFDQCQR